MGMSPYTACVERGEWQEVIRVVQGWWRLVDLLTKAEVEESKANHDEE